MFIIYLNNCPFNPNHLIVASPHLDFNSLSWCKARFVTVLTLDLSSHCTNHCRFSVHCLLCVSIFWIAKWYDYLLLRFFFAVFLLCLFILLTVGQDQCLHFRFYSFVDKHVCTRKHPPSPVTKIMYNDPLHLHLPWTTFFHLPYPKIPLKDSMPLYM